jgi:hypothetical protein
MKEDKTIISGKMRSGLERHGSLRSSHNLSIEELIARIQFKRTIRRLIKLIKS